MLSRGVEVHPKDVGFRCTVAKPSAHLNASSIAFVNSQAHSRTTTFLDTNGIRCFEKSMATWKDLGEVPDSEDEGDSDCLDCPSPPRHLDFVQFQHLPRLRATAYREPDEAIPQPAPGLAGSRGWVDEEIEGVVGGHKSQSGGERQHANVGLRQEDRTTQSSLTPLDDLLIPSLTPELGFESIQNIELKGNNRLGTSQVRTDTLADDVSRSYVQITSTSPLSSPLGNLFRSVSPELLIGRRDVSGPGVNHSGEANTPPLRQRSFRQRKQIQLHPYGIEQQKYQRTLKERGIAPIVIAASQHKQKSQNTSFPTESQVSDSDILDFEDSSDDGFVVNEDSQFSRGALQRSPTPRQSLLQDVSSQAGRQAADDAMESDEEFPDIDELLSRKPDNFSVSRKRRPLQQYNIKSKKTRLAWSKHPTQVGSPDAISTRNIPASPPTTSPLLHAPDHRTISRTTSASSRDSPSLTIPAFWLMESQQDSIPTPAASSAKRSPVVYIDSESDVEPTLPTLKGAQRSTSPSSSEESIELRKVGKRIRGVLPASHLRLETKRQPQAKSSTLRKLTRSPSPVIRRGIAKPALSRNAPIIAASLRADTSFLDEFSDDDDNGDGYSHEHVEEQSERDSMFIETRIGSAVEDDHVDPMLPSRKRPSKSSTSRLSSFKKKDHSHIRRRNLASPKRQPRITEHFDNPPVSTRRSGRQSTSNTSTKKKRVKRLPEDVSRIPQPPELSILDFAEPTTIRSQPLFIRIATRTARARSDFGRQSLNQKYFRLATREDTQDVQSVVQAWKDLKLKPKDLAQSYSIAQAKRGRGFRLMANNKQTRLPSPQNKSHLQALSNGSLQPMAPKRLMISNVSQQSIDNFVHHRDANVDSEALAIPRNPNPPLQRTARSLQRSARPHVRPVIRPAQLEEDDKSHSGMVRGPSFSLSKRLLDILHWGSRKSKTRNHTLPLDRFLAERDVPLETTETSNTTVKIDSRALRDSVVLARDGHRKKLRPRRFDIGAAMYRQPSNPLILEDLEHAPVSDETKDKSRLSGLGNYGTSYTVAFDICPLPQGVYFHQSTFIGSGRLAQILDSTKPYIDVSETSFRLSLGAKQFVWRDWTDDVSSELGLCFDWLVDQIVNRSDANNSESPDKSVDLSEMILKYSQLCLACQDVNHMTKMLIRFIEVLQDFTNSLKGLVNTKELGKYQLRVLQHTLLIYYGVLKLCRKLSDLSHYAFQIEDHLRSFSQVLIKFLLSFDLDDTRKMYDRMQFLSIRERGIQNDDIITETWVIVVRVLEEACIRKGSFWDVVNTEILSRKQSPLQDAPAMEKLWYKMFSLLPLCEFNDEGRLITGNRYVAKFDNWTLPQKFLKSIFDLYKSNPRQPPTFNDYCRTLFHRCHHLMVEWGWWNCNALLGTIFDFFASQNLGHLRNEEAYTSPGFLKELHLNPSLAVEPEDRCFHIFLKITAVGIKHLMKTGGDKLVRSLVARLLPNHDRQYAKEDEVHQRDLASLRNHHDLLCTLYWAAPTRHHPSPALLQKLVAFDSSHNQACLINLRAWENLTRFVVAMTPTDEIFSPFSTWQKSALNALWHQYQDAELNVRRQADELLANNISGITETQIKETTKLNREATRPIISTMLRAMGYVRNVNMPLAVANMLFDIDFLAHILQNKPEEDFSDSVIDALTYYIELLSRPITGSESDDSQLSEFEWDIMLRFESISNLAKVIVPPLRNHLQSLLKTASAKSPSPAVVDCWTGLVYLLSKENIQDYELRHFVGTGPHALFDHRKLLADSENNFWIFFISKMQLRSLADDRPCSPLETAEFDISAEWLRLLVQPLSKDQLTTVIDLSVQLHNSGHCLLRLPVSLEGVALPSTVKDLEVKDSTVVRRLKPKEILRWALSSMKGIVQGGPSHRPVQLSRTAAKDLFGWQLQYLMRSMQERLQNMDYNSYQHKKYVEYVQGVCEIIQVYCSGIRPLENFFQYTSTHYWPPQGDPDRFAPFVKSFSLNLAGEHPKKAARELYHFLLASFDRALTSGTFHNHMCNLGKAMREPTFMTFVLDELIAPMIDMGFAVHSTPGGWLFCAAYLPVLGNLLSEYLLSPSRALKHLCTSNTPDLIPGYVMKVAQTIVFFIHLYQKSYRCEETGRLDMRYREILAIALDFWHTILPGLLRYHVATKEIADFVTLKASFEELATNLGQFLRGQDFTTTRPIYSSNTRFRGTFYEEFRHGFETYVVTTWTIGRSDGSIMINKQGRKLEFGHIDGSRLKNLEPNSIGIRRPDLSRSIIHLKQTTLNYRKEQDVSGLLATYV